jgi:UDP-glucose 4-epimerase
VASRDNLAGCRAVVFGGCGFLGSHLVSALIDAGADTVVFDMAPAGDGLAGEAACVLADACDEAAVRRAVEGADRIFAFAGGGGAPSSLQDPLSDLAASCRAQLVLLEAVRKECPQATVVFPGSRLEYGRPIRLPVDESHPLNGDSPYAIHKSACAAYYRAYAKVHGLNTIVLRLSNPYGPHALSKAFRGFGILNHFVDRVMIGEPILLFGDGSQLRDFIFIDDVVEAVIAASGRPDLAGEVITVGAGEGVPLAHIAAEIIALAGHGTIKQVPWPGDFSAVETGDFYFDVTLARMSLGWQPRTSLRRGLEFMLQATGTRPVSTPPRSNTPSLTRRTR